jgi:hypothetical protein
MGTEIRELQAEVLDLRSAARLLTGIAKSGVKQFRQANTDNGSDSSTELVKPAMDQVP